MLIQLKQSEIEAALCLYLEHQGIHLENRTVAVGFTASRGNAGTVADITIEERLLGPPTTVVGIRNEFTDYAPPAPGDAAIEEKKTSLFS